MQLRSGTLLPRSQSVPPYDDRPGLDSVSHDGSPTAQAADHAAITQDRAHHAQGYGFGPPSPPPGGVYGPYVSAPVVHPTMFNPLFAHPHPAQLPASADPWVAYSLGMVGAQKQEYLPMHLPPISAPPAMLHPAQAWGIYGPPADDQEQPRRIARNASPHEPVDTPRSSARSVVDQLAAIVEAQQQQLAQQAKLVERLLDDRGAPRGHPDARPLEQPALQELKLQTTYDAAVAACPKLKRLEPRCVVQFVRHAKKHFSKYSIPDKPVLDRLSSIVVDKAADWLDSQLLLQSTGEQAEWTSLNDFLTKLQDDHPEPVASFLVLQELITPKIRQSGRSVSVYHSELVRLFATEHHSFEQRFQVAYFMLGLDTDVQSQLMRAYPSSLREAFTAAAAIEASIRPGATRQPPKPNAEEQKQFHRQQRELREQRLQHLDRFKQGGQRQWEVPSDRARPGPNSSPRAAAGAPGSRPFGNRPKEASPQRSSHRKPFGGKPQVHSIFISDQGESLVFDPNGKLVDGESYLIADEDLREMKASAIEDPSSSYTAMPSSGK